MQSFRKANKGGLAKNRGGRLRLVTSWLIVFSVINFYVGGIFLASEVRAVNETSYSIEITSLTAGGATYTNPLPMLCGINPLGGEVTISGEGFANDPVGTSGQYGVKVAWGDGTVEVVDIDITETGDGKDFSYTFTGTHTFTGDFVSESIYAKLYHQVDQGNDDGDAAITYEPCPDGYGSIAVCKMLIDIDGELVTDASEYSGDEFSIKLAHTAEVDSVFEIVDFTADSFTPNATILSDSQEPDAECQYFNVEVPTSNTIYHYREEKIEHTSGYEWEAPRYNDQYTETVSTLDDFYLFDANSNANGILRMAIDENEGALRHRELVILNQAAPAPTTANLTVCKYEDMTNDGTSEDDSIYTEGWNFTIYDQVSSEVDSGVTDENGCVAFELDPGTYHIAEDLREHWDATDILVDDQNVTVLENEEIGNFVTLTLEAGDDNTVSFYNYNVPFCGDGVKNQQSEQCDGTDGVTEGYFCNDSCELESTGYSAYCGDGYLNQDWEQCDGTEGCTEQCLTEVQYECNDLVLARLIDAAIENTGDGDVTSDIFLGATDTVIPEDAWFPVYQNGAYINDSDTNSYEDVPGLAVQRLDGQLRVVLHAGHQSGQGHFEHIDGIVEFSNATVALPLDDSANPLENGFDDSYGYYLDDEVWVEHDAAIGFYLSADSGDDGFYIPLTVINACDYSSYCGDGAVNQDWEQCDGTTNCTEQCQFTQQLECSDLVLARINNASVTNEGDGNMTDDIYLGGAENIIPNGSWFALYENGAFAVDSNISNYEDVPGLAVQRLQGRVRAVMHGSHGEGEEHVDGTVEFYNASVDSLTSDSSNPLEKGFDGSMGGASDDEVWSDSSSVVNYWLTGTTGDDGFYAHWSIDNHCLYGEYCGDGVTNQSWEQCDGGQNCTEQCQFVEQTMCTDLILARITDTTVRNSGNGNMTDDIYLGSSSAVIPVGTWFPLYVDGAYITDLDSDSYEDVPGLAVQRLEGRVRAVLHASHGSSSHQEHIDGTIEFFNTIVAGVADDISNPLEKGFDSSIGGAGDDEVWSTADDTVQFWLTGTTGDDGFYADWSQGSYCQNLEDAICGYKFEDRNGDAVWQEQTEPGVEGWTITATHDDQELEYVTQTDENGAYCFYDLAPGNWTLTEESRIGWTQTWPGPNDEYDGQQHIYLTGDNAAVGVLFGNRQNTTEEDAICGYKFEDLNGDAVWQQDTEPAISDWQIFAQRNGEGTIFATSTNDEGLYCFYNLEPGNWVLTEEEQEGWTQSWPGGDGKQRILLTGSNSAIGVLFGNYQPAELSGYKYFDENGNGVLDEGENGLSGWEMILTFNDATTTSTTTDATGFYFFDQLRPGSYSVAEVLEPYWTQTFPEEGGYSVDLTSGESFTEADFYNYYDESLVCEDYTIAGLKFYDSNRNGQYDEGEALLQEWEFGAQHAAYSEEFDFDDSGRLDEADVVLITDVNLGNVECPEGKNCDFNGDSVVDLSDVSEFSNYVLMSIFDTQYSDTNGEFLFTLDPEQVNQTLINQEPLFGTVIVYETLPEGWSSSTTAIQFVDVASCEASVYFGNYLDSEDLCGNGYIDFDEACDDGNTSDGDGCSAQCTTEESNPGGGGGSGGGGGGGGSTSLTIFNESESGVTVSSADLTWFTNLSATSRVVFDTVSHADVIGVAPNYGYAQSTSEDSSKVTYRTVSLSGLTPETTYYWRAVSATSNLNEKFGIERSFTTPAEGQVLGDETENPGDGGNTSSTGNTTPPSNPTGQPTPQTNSELTGGTQPTGAGGQAGEVLGAESGEIQQQGDTQKLAQQGNEEPAPTPTTTEDSDCATYIWVLLILNIIGAAIAWKFGQTAHQAWARHWWWILLVGSILPTLIWFAGCGLVTWLIVTFLVSVVLTAMMKKQASSTTPQQS